MNQEISQKLKDWRSRKANLEGVERYVILHNRTIDEIADRLPTNEKEFKAIKGLGGKKFEKYGKEILAIVREFSGEVNQSVQVNIDVLSDSEERIISVSDFLNLVNSKLVKIKIGVKGEISSVSLRGHAYFTLQDKEDGSVVNCFMRASDYQMSGVEIKEGMEVIIRGYPEVYKPSGKLSFQSFSIELVGEGALKKAYDELKKKLTVEGIFDESKKRPIPAFPLKIGLITSKDGAVIHDFQSNLGRFGYKVSLYDSRVEGAQAVRDLINATRYFKNKEIDVLVVIRGGGSLESLQAFNNEALIREIVDYPVPVICGIGHDKDVPLFSLSADRAESTPSFVARELNRTWEQAVDKIGRYESDLIGFFSSVLSDNDHRLNNYFHQFNGTFQKIVQKISAVDRIISNILNQLGRAIKDRRSHIDQSTKGILSAYSGGLTECSNRLGNLLKLLQQNNPSRQLKLGYSIVFSGGKVVKSVHQVNQGDKIINKVSDGDIQSTVSEIKSKE